MEQLTLYIGIAAGICTSVSLIPQLFKLIKTKKAGDISYFMLFILLAGVGLWIWYGSLKGDYPIILTNALSFLVNLLVIFFSFKFRNREEAK